MASQPWPAVPRLEEHVARRVDRLGIVGRDHDGEGPLEAVFHSLGSPAHGILGIDGDVALLLRAMVVARDLAVVAARVDDVGVARLGGDVTALAAAHRVPVGHIDAHAARAAGDGDRRVVLLRAVDPVGEAVVGGDVVELRGRLVVLLRPGGPSVERHVGAPVVGADHAERVVRGDPQAVVVAVGRAHDGEGLARRPGSGRTARSARRPRPRSWGRRRRGCSTRRAAGASARRSSSSRSCPRRSSGRARPPRPRRWRTRGSGWLPRRSRPSCPRGPWAGPRPRPSSRCRRRRPTSEAAAGAAAVEAPRGCAAPGTVPAKSTRGLVGSMARSTAPVFSST